MQEGRDDIEIFCSSKPHTTSCGISPCAWGAPREITKFMSLAGLNPAKYVINVVRTMDFEGIELPCEMYIFNKPAMIKDLLDDAIPSPEPIRHSLYTRIIDATGVARAYLPDIKNDRLGYTAQVRCASPMPKWDTKVYVRFMEMGYMWAFPMNDHLHLGCGGIRNGNGKQEYSARVLLQSALHKQLGQPTSICGCQARVRITGPERAIPFSTQKSYRFGNVVGVGEAIGAVSPLSGEGNVPGLMTCEALLDNWDSPVGYYTRVTTQLAWMEEERKLMDYALAGGQISFNHIDLVLKNAERLGIHVSTDKALEMFEKLSGGK
jgi:hypothetical protein